MRLPCAESGSGAHVMRFLKSLVGRISLWCTREMSQGADVCKEMPFCTWKISEGKNLWINVNSRLFTHTLRACTIFGSNWHKLYCFSHQTADFGNSLCWNRSKIVQALHRWHKINCTSYVKGLAQFALCNVFASCCALHNQVGFLLSSANMPVSLDR